MTTIKTDNRTVLRFEKFTIVLHWVHTAAFLILVVTGAITFLQTGDFSNIYISQILHRAGAVIFIAIPVISCVLKPQKASDFIKETFRWNRDDIMWILSAPDYYFGGAEDRMPPQNRINAGQKLWQGVVIVTGVIFIITGLILWGFRSSLPISAYQWLLFIHGIAFVIVFLMFLLHVYLGIFHPWFRESLRSMVDGKISPTYAKKHYRKWYEKL